MSRRRYLLVAACCALGCAERGAAPRSSVGEGSAGGERASASAGAPEVERAVEATVEPAAAEPAAPADRAPDPLPSDPVFLNGSVLGAPDLRELQAVLGQAPAPGRYWYDARSGLWGLQDHGAGGVTRAGLRVPAPLPADASRGTSGAFVNDRQLTARELAVLARLLGWDGSRLASFAGRYVLDEQGGLYTHQGRYLGSVAAAAPRMLQAGTSPAPCAWLQLGATPGVLGRGVTVNCD